MPLNNGADRNLRWFIEDVWGRFDSDHTRQGAPLFPLGRNPGARVWIGEVDTLTVVWNFRPVWRWTSVIVAGGHRVGIAAQFSKSLHKEINAHAAWFPVTNSFELGDYGLVSDGVFQRIGNIAEFSVEFTSKASKPASIDFKSEDAKLVSVVADAEVNALPDAPIDARFRIELGKKGSYYARAADTTAIEMTNIREVAGGLARALGWRRKYRVVSSIITGHDCLIVTAQADHATYELSGQASALKNLNVGAMRAGVSITNDTNVGFTVAGETGVVGLRLFKLRWFGDQVQLLGPEGKADYEVDTADELEDDV